MSREAQNEYSLRSQSRMAAAQRDGKFADEIVPMTTTMNVVDKASGEVSRRETVVDRDDCNRPDTTLEGLAGLKPVKGEGKTVTAGNASQGAVSPTATRLCGGVPSPTQAESRRRGSATRPMRLRGWP